jgi:hypothetical protein
MNAFEDIIYRFIDWIDLPIPVFLLGGFVLSVVLGVLAVTPWYRGMPHRIWLAVSGVFPVVVLIYGQVFDLFVRGRQLGLMLALSPFLLVFIPPAVSLCQSIRIAESGKRIRFMALLTGLLFGQAWATLVCWMATNYGFMGASC